MNSPMIENRKASYNYFIQDTLECGIQLRGNEVKSIRAGKCTIKEAWCQIQDGNLVLRGMHVSKWDTANSFDIDEIRERMLLAHKREINKLSSDIKESGLTLVPLKVYFLNGKCKVLIGICKGKHNYDKRNCLKEKQIARDINRQA